MSSVNSDLQIEYQGSVLTLEDLEGKPSTEVVEILTVALEGLSDDQRAEYIEGLGELGEEIEESIYLHMEEIEEEMKEYDEDGDEFFLSKLEDKIEYDEELLKLIDDFDDYVEEANNHIDFFTQTVTSNTTVEWNTDDSNEVAEGDIVKIEVEGGDNGEGLGLDTEEGEESLPEYSVNVTVNIGDDKIQDMYYNEATNTITCTILTEEGVTFDLELIGPAQFTFNGVDYIDTNKLSSLHDDALMMCFDGTDRFYNYVYGFDSAEAAGMTEIGSETLDALPADIESINEILAASYTDDSGEMRAALSSYDQEVLEDMLLQILSTDVYQTESSITMAQAWEEIWELTSDLSDERKNAVFGALQLILAKHDSANYSVVFYEGIQGKLTEINEYNKYAEGIDNEDDALDAFSKAVTMVMNNFSAAAMTPSATMDQEGWTDYDETMIAVDFLDDNFTELALAEAKSDLETEAVENPMVTFDNCYDKIENTLMDYFYDSIPAELRAYYESWAPAFGMSDREVRRQAMAEYYTDTVWDEMLGYFDSLFSILTSNSPMTKEAMQNDIESFIGSISYNYQDDVASVFMMLLNDTQNELFKTLVDPSDLDATDDNNWAVRMWDTFINNGNKEAACMDDVKALFLSEDVIL